jgi:hypothetical protein
MENKLSRLFDYQKYAPNDKLTSIIRDVESRYSLDLQELSDDELGMLNAAGSVEMEMARQKELEEQNLRK